MVAKATRPEAVLSAEHLNMLRDGSGISAEVLLARGYRTITENGTDKLLQLGFSNAQARPGLLIPIHPPDGSNTLYRLKPDNPRVREKREKGKLPDGTYPQHVIKYEQPKGEGLRIDCNPECRPQLADPSIPLWVTEGEKKADSLTSLGACAISLPGVWGFKGKNEFGGVTVLADLDHIAWNGRTVYAAFDNDVLTNSQVQAALERFTEIVKRRGAAVEYVHLPASDGDKTGVDDYIVEHGSTLDDLQALATGAMPKPKAKPASVELMTAPPAAITRPMSLIGGRGYAAVWPYLRVTRDEKLDRNGNIITLDPPEVTTEQRLMIVRDDGAIFGPGGKPIEELGIEVNLPFIPRYDQLWSTPAVQLFVRGERVTPAEVFGRVVDLVDTFIDFNRSLAPQRVMAELVACYITATFMLPAFSVAGYLYPNGDRGTGKTQLLTVVTESAYLGQFTTAGGTFAALRDLKDYGATLGIDDAENVSDTRKIDPDKRALLLAGNRRNSSVPLKELTGNNTWQIRHVRTFGFTVFTAIRQPDPVLASRSIVVPLIRTADRAKGNIDPADWTVWPHDRRQLVDDLWALGLANIAKMPEYEKQTGKQAQLVGRNLEPWRAILATALWLDDHGVDGLWERMDQLSIDYQQERAQLEYGDLTYLLIKALGKVLSEKCEGCEACEPCEGFAEGVHILTSAITDAAHSIAEDEELPINADKLTSQRVGMGLSAMRLSKKREPGTGKSGWMVSLQQLEALAISYGLQLSDIVQGVTLKPSQPSLTSQPSQNGAGIPEFDVRGGTL